MNKQPKPFDLEAAKNGAEILFDGDPCKFVAHVPYNEPEYRVVISYNGRVRDFTEDGRYIDGEEVRLTMAPCKEKTVGYRDYYAWWGASVVRRTLRDVGATPRSVERNGSFIRWIHDTWQYDEVEL